MKTYTKILLIIAASGFASLGITSLALAYTNPEVVDLAMQIAKMGLDGLKAYFDFLIDLFREAVKLLM